MFVANPTGEPGDDKVYVNPVLTDAEGGEEAEEGCLSLPDIHVKVIRPTARLKMQAQDLAGQPFEQIAEGFLTRSLAARDRPPQRRADHRPHERRGKADDEPQAAAGSWRRSTPRYRRRKSGRLLPGFRFDTRHRTETGDAICDREDAKIAKGAQGKTR